MAETAKTTGFGVRLPPQPTDEPPSADQAPVEAVPADARCDHDPDPAPPHRDASAAVVRGELTAAPAPLSQEHLAHVAQLGGQLRALEGFAAQFHRDVGQALGTLGQRLDLVARQQQSLGLRAKAVELAGAFRDVLSEKGEILPLARSLHEFLIKDQAPPPEPVAEPEPEEPPLANGEDKSTRH